MFAELAIDMNPFRRDLRAARGEAEQAVSGMERSGGRLSGMFSSIGSAFKNVFTGMAVGAGIAAFDKLTSAASKAFGLFKQGISLNVEYENASARINAFTKDSAKTAELLEKIRIEAAKTPFAFQDMANAMGSLLPVSKASGVAIDDLIKQAEILAASNPLEGLEGASFSLREAMTGDFTSIIERFNLSRQSINKWKAEGLSNMEIISRAMKEMGYDADLVAQMGATMSGRWSTLIDTGNNLLRVFASPIFDVFKTWLGSTQGLLDDNNAKMEALAKTLGERVAGGLTRATEGVRLFIEGWRGIGTSLTRDQDPIAAWGARAHRVLSSARSGVADFVGSIKAIKDGWDGTALSFNRGFDDWEKRGATAREVIDAIRGGFEQTRDVLASGDFHGGGPFAEDAPLMVGLLGFHAALDAAREKLTLLQSKVQQQLPAMQMPELPGAVGVAGAAGAAGAGALALGPALKPLLGVVSSLLPMLGSLALAMGPVGWGLTALGVAAAGLYVAWDQNLGGIQDITKRALGGLGEFVDGTVRPALDRLAQSVEPLRADFLSFWTNELSPVVSQIGANLSTAFDEAKTAIDGFVATVTPGVERFFGGLRDLGGAVLPVIASVGGKIRDDLGPAVLKVAEWGRDIIPEFSAAWKNVLGVVGPILGGIASLVGGFLTGMAGFITDHKETVVSVFTSIWDIVKGVVTIGASLIGGFISTWLNVLQGDWSGAWESIKGTVSGVWDGIKLIVSGAIGLVKSELTLGMEAAKTLMGNAWVWIRDRTEQVGGEIKQKASDFIDGITAKVDGVKEGIKSGLLWPFEQARDKIGGIMDTFRDKMLGPLRTARDGMQSFVNGVVSGITGIAGGLGIKVEITAPQLPAFANGVTNWRGGIAWVGEEGPEIMYVPQHASIIPAPESKALASAGALPGFAGGLNIPGLGGLMDFFGKAPEKIIQMALDAAGVKIPTLPGVLGGGGAALMDTVKNWLVGKVKEWISKALPVSGESMQRMINAAEAALGTPYLYGGGHGATSAGPWDCSGFVRYILDTGGISNPAGIVTDFYNWMVKTGGPSGILGIGVNNPYDDPRVQHVGIRLMGTQYESGGPFGGVGKNGTNFAEWGVPPGWEKAKGEAAQADSTWANILGGKSGQWGGTAPPPVSTLLDYLKKHPRALTGGGVQRLADALPANGWTKMAAGGVIDEAVVGVGQDSGIQYLLGEAGREIVIPANLLPQIVSYFQRVMQTGELSNEFLVGVPLELRGVLQRVARDSMAEARTRRANQANGGAAGYTSNGGPVKPLASPVPFLGGVPDTRGLNNRPFTDPPSPLRPSTTATDIAARINQPGTAPTTGTPLGGRADADEYLIARGVDRGLRSAEDLLRSVFANPRQADPTIPPLGGDAPPGPLGGGKAPTGAAGARRTAAEQMQIARTTGQFEPGELLEDDPAIVAMIAEYRRGKAGIDNGAYNPGIGLGGPAGNPDRLPGGPLGPGLQDPGGNGESGPGAEPMTLSLRITLDQAAIGAAAIVTELETEPIQFERLAGGTLRLVTKELAAIKKELGGGR